MGGRKSGGLLQPFIQTCSLIFHKINPRPSDSPHHEGQSTNLRTFHKAIRYASQASPTPLFPLPIPHIPISNPTNQLTSKAFPPSTSPPRLQNLEAHIKPPPPTPSQKKNVRTQRGSSVAGPRTAIRGPSAGHARRVRQDGGEEGPRRGSPGPDGRPVE